MSEAAFIPAERLTAVERWEIGSIVEVVPAASPQAAPAQERAAEAERAAAREQGYREGHAAGAAAARVETERLRRVATAASDELRALEAQLAGDVLALALAVARQVVRAEVRVRRDALLAVVREALAQLPHAAGVAQVVLHPDDVAVVRAHLGDELDALGMAIAEDPRIESGGCRLVSPMVEIDATLRTRWRRVVAALGSNDDWHG